MEERRKVGKEREMEEEKNIRKEKEEGKGN